MLGDAYEGCSYVVKYTGHIPEFSRWKLSGAIGLVP